MKWFFILYGLSITLILGFWCGRALAAESVFNQVNSYRVSSHLSPLKYNRQLADIAAERGIDMLEYDYFAHVSPLGNSLYTYPFKEGQICSRQENLSIFYGTDEVLDRWLESSAHYTNIVGDWTESGTAIVTGTFFGRQGQLIIQEFARCVSDGEFNQIIANLK